MPLEQLNLSQNDISEIKIEEVQKLLSKINDNSYLSDFDLDGNKKDLSKAEQSILERLQEIENKTEFIENLLRELRNINISNTLIWSIEDISNRGILSLGIDFFNKKIRSKEWILQDLNNSKNNFSNELINNYINQEITRIETWLKEPNDWTMLLLSYIENNNKWLTSWLWITRNIHNTTQEDYIKNILWNQKWYNNSFIQWYSNEISNFLIKINDFEDYLSSEKTVIDTQNDWWIHNSNVVNSKAIWNYMEYLLDKNSWDIPKTINNLKNVIGEQKITSLWYIWKRNNNTIAQSILNKNPNGKLLVDSIKEPNKILEIEESDNDLVYSIIEVWWNDFIKDLKAIIEENKDSDDYRDKIKKFLEAINSDECPASVKTKANIIIQMYEWWEEITNQTINSRYNDISFEWKWKVENEIIQSLWLYASWWMSVVENNISPILNISNQVFSNTTSHTQRLSIINEDFAREEKINLINVVNNLWSNDEDKIKKILKFIDETDRNSCWPIFWGMGIESVNLYILYKRLSNKLIEINNEKIKTKLSDIVKQKWLSEQENELIVNEIFEKIKWVDCNTELIKIISDTFKKYWIEYDFDDKKWLTDFIDIQINIEEVRIKSETFWQQISNNEYLERIEEINRRRENNEVLKRSNDEEFNELITNLKNWVDSKKAMNDLNKRVNEREKIENKINWNQNINSNYIIENKNLSFTNNKWNSVNIALNQTEQKLVKSNPEIIENIINFYNVLDRIWLSKLWNIKDSIFNSISNVEWIWFNIDWDYLNENEIKIFLNSILKSVGESQINNFLTLNDFLAQIEIKNNTQITWNEAQVNMYWDTYIEAKFIENFSPRNSAIFNSNLFENSLK
jgi:hypothetical protein